MEEKHHIGDAEECHPEHKETHHHEHKEEHHTEHKDTEHKELHYAGHKEGHIRPSCKDYLKKKSAVWILISGILALLLVVSVLTNGSFWVFGKSSLTPEKAAEKAVGYINSNLLQAGITAKVEGIEEFEGMYKIKLSIGGRNYDSYVTKDGKTLFPTAVELEDAVNQPAEKKSAEELCKEMKKVDKAKLEMFYVSRCPFGVQAINSLYYVAKNFKGRAEIIPKLLVTPSADGKSTISMHGEQEHKEDLRHVCLREEQPDAYWEYIHCYSETGESEKCEKTAKVNSAELADCEKERAEGYALKDAEEWENIHRPKHTALKGGAGSPSFSLNGEAISEYEFSPNGRSPENLKAIICCSLEEKLAECSNALQTAQPPRGFGKIESGSASAGGSDTEGQGLNC